jgi:hypothetical protein
MASDLIGNLAVNLTMNTAAFQNGANIAEKRAAALQTKMSGIGNSIKGIGASLVTGFAAFGASELVSNAFNVAASMQEMAASAGVTIVQLQRLRQAGLENGASADQMDASLQKLNVRLGEAKSGIPSAVAAFTSLGISIDQIKNLNAGDMFALLVEKISAIKDPSLQASAAKAVLGKSYATLLPLIVAGTKALDDATEASKRNGELSEQDAAKLDELADSWEGFKVRVGVSVATFIANVAQASDAANKNFFDPINKWTKETDAAIYNMFVKADKWFKGLHDAAYKWLVGGLKNVFSEAKKQIASLDDKFFGLYDAVVGNSYIPDMVTEIGQHMRRLNTEMVKPGSAATEDVARSFQELQAKVSGILSRLFPEVQQALSYDTDKNALQEWAAKGKIGADALTASLVRLRAERYGLEQSMPAVNDNPSLADLGIDLQAMINKNLPIMPDAPGKTFEDFLIGVQNVSAGVANSMQDMQNSVSGFVQSIKKGDIIGIIGGPSNVISAGLGIFGKIKVLSIPPGRARGGKTTSGRTYMVGERGPELFTANKSGYVTPNKDMNSRGGRASSLKIVPSKYFDVVVDGRAANVAQPMAAQAAAVGSASAQSALMRRANRRLE